MKRLICFLLVAGVLAATARLAAQIADDAIRMPVGVSFRFDGDPDLEHGQLATIQLFGWRLGGQPDTDASAGASGWGHEAGPTHFHLVPGRTAQISVSPARIWAYTIDFDPPAGYRFVVDGIERRRVRDGDHLSYVGPRSFAVRLEELTPASPADATSLRPGAIIWHVGVGALSNGRSAGTISLREDGLSANTFTPAALIFDDSFAEVERIPALGTLQQVATPQYLVDINASGPHATTIAFYTWDQVDVAARPAGQRYPLLPHQGAVFHYKIENPQPGSTERLLITRRTFVHGAEDQRWTELRRVSGQWRVTDWTSESGALPGLVETRWDYSDQGRNETIEVRNGKSGAVAARTAKRFEIFPWGPELVRTTHGSGGPNLVTHLAYHADPAQQGDFRKSRHTIQPDGNWVRYDYYDDFDRRGLPFRVFAPFRNAPATPDQAGENVGQVTTFSYVPDWTGKPVLPSVIETRVNGTVTSRSELSYADDTRAGRPVMITTRRDYTRADHFLTTVSTTYRDDEPSGFFQNLPHSEKRPDGSYAVHGYLLGAFDFPSGTFTTEPHLTSTRAHVTVRGTHRPQLGPATDSAPTVQLPFLGQQSLHTLPTENDFYLVRGRSTAEAVFRRADTGVAVAKLSFVYTSNGTWQLVDRERYEYTAGTFLVRTRRDSGLPPERLDTGHHLDVEQNWAGGLLRWAEDAEGIRREWLYDFSARATHLRIVGVGQQPQSGDQWIVTEFDAAGRTVAEANRSTPGEPGEEIRTETTYDLAGRVTVRRQVAGQTPAGQQLWTVTEMQYSHGGNPRATRTVARGVLADGSDTEQIEERFLDGQRWRLHGSGVVAETFDTGVEATGFFAGHRWTHASTGGGSWGPGWRQRYTDWLGREIMALAPAIEESTNTETQYHWETGLVLSRRTWWFNGSANVSLVAPTWLAYDSMGAVVREWVDVNENTNTTNNLTADLAGPDRVTDTRRALVLDGGAWWAEIESLGYFHHGDATPRRLSLVRERLSEITGTLRGEKRTVDANGLLSREEIHVDRAQRRREVRQFFPDAQPGGAQPGEIMINGRVRQRTSREGHVALLDYDALGRIQSTRSRDQVREDRTYWPGTLLLRAINNHGLHPGSIGTHWKEMFYDAAGRAIFVRQNETGHYREIRTSFTARGQVWRQWGNGIDPVEYAYDATTGRRTHLRTFRSGTGWADATWPAGSTGPADTTTWTHHGPTGLVLHKTDALGRATSFTYNPQGQVITREWARLNPQGTARLRTTYEYFEDPAAQGGRTGQLRRVSYNDGTTPEVRYGYHRHGGVFEVFDATGRRDFTYRDHDLQLVRERLDWGFYGHEARIEHFHESGPVAGRTTGLAFGWPGTLDQNYRVDYGYESATGRLASITARHGSVQRTFGYTYAPGSNLVQRLVQGAFQRETFWQSWRGVQDSVRTRFGTTTVADFQYDYDWSGRRIGARLTGALAQSLGYLAGAHHGARDVYSYTRKGQLDFTSSWLTDAAGNNLTQRPARNADFDYDHRGNRTLELQTGGQFQYATNALNQYVSQSGTPGVSRAPWQWLTYDLDGNLTQNHQWQFFYDGENRLVEMRQVGGPRRIHYVYDYRHRRVEVRVVDADVETSRLRSVWHEWNLLAELQGAAPTQVTRRFYWGLDVTGTLHGGGGVGGLLLVAQGGQDWLPVVDANGNVHGLVDGAGQVAAAYELGPNGEVFQAVGVAAAVNPFRFATKWHDAETGLVYYNHRYYSADLGRFLNRDPIAETGGINLYEYCGSDGVNHSDYLGMFNLGKFFGKIGRWISKNWKPIVAVVASVVTMGVAYYAYAAYAAAAGITSMKGVTMAGAMKAVVTGTMQVGAYGKLMMGAAAGFGSGLVTGGLRGGLKGALGGILTAGIGAAFTGVAQGAEQFSAAWFGREGLRAAAHGVSGGAMSALSGGSFRAGFTAGAFSSIAKEVFPYEHVPDSARFASAMTWSGVTGGLGSVISGGQFSSGFTQGAQTFLLNGWLTRLGQLAGIESGAQLLSAALDLLPVVGQIKSAVEVVTGYDFVAGQDVCRLSAATGLLPWGKVVRRGGEAVMRMGDDVAPRAAGAYREVAGHHVHAKKAFEGTAGYDLREAFSVSADVLKQHGARHADVTSAQQRLFREFAASGAPNTLTHHSRIAYQAMVEAGMPPAVAKDLVIQSQSQLIRSGVVEPSRIPWGGR